MGRVKDISISFGVGYHISNSRYFCQPCSVIVYEAGMEEVAEESLPPEVLLKTAVVQTMIGF